MAIFTQLCVSRYEMCIFSAGLRVVNGTPGFGASHNGCGGDR